MSEPSRNPFKGMRRFPDDGWIAGVCTGIAAYYDWSAKIVRLIAVIGLFASCGWAILIYLVLWYILDPVRGAAPPAGTMSPPGTPPASGGGPDLGNVKARFADLEARLRSIEECVTDQAYELRRELRKLET